MEAGFGIAGDDIDGPAKAAVVPHVEGALPHLDPLHLRKVDVKGRRVHVIGAGPIDAVAIHREVEVTALEAAQDDVVGDAPLPQGPQAGNGPEGSADISSSTFAKLRGLEAVLYRGHRLHHDMLTEHGEGKPQVPMGGFAGVEDEGVDSRRREACALDSHVP